MTSTVPPGVEDESPIAQVAEASKNPMDLEQENQRLKEAQTCKICMDNQIGVVFLPCGHFICCVKCAPSLRDCPYCRQSIHGTVKTYMSWIKNHKELIICINKFYLEKFMIIMLASFNQSVTKKQTRYDQYTFFWNFSWSVWNFMKSMEHNRVSNFATHILYGYRTDF